MRGRAQQPRLEQGIVEATSWGRLVWQISASLENSTWMTFGRCFINPGESNARHSHPNCDEVLSVVRGSVIHSFADREIPMEAGDTIIVPSGVIHNARNVGDDVAEMVIVFSSADRQTVAAAEGGAGAA